MEQATHNKEEIPTKKKATPTGKIPRKRNVADTVTNDTNPNPTKKSTPANHNLVNRTTWSPAKMYKEFHKHIVYIYNLIEQQIFICAIKRGCDNKAFFTKPIKDMFRNDPDKCLEDFHILSLEQLRDPSAEQSLNKPLPKTIKGDFNEEGFICYREDGESIEDFKIFFCNALTAYANEPDSGYFGCDNEFHYQPEPDVNVAKPINVILRDKPTVRCCKKLYWEPGMTKEQMIAKNPDILIKFWGSSELGNAMLDQYDDEQWQRLA